MIAILIGAAAMLGVLILFLQHQSSEARKKSDLLESQMGELRRDLQTIGTAQARSTGEIASIGQSVSQRLESVAKALQEGVSSSAQIANQGQTAIATELKNTRDQMGQIQKQLGEFQELSRGVSLATKSLEGILGGAKTRGLLGEVTLGRLLEDCLPPSQFSTQYRFASGEAADAVIFLRDAKLMAIDSKFPLDAFRRITTDGDEARRAFVTAVKGHADSIAKKYIVPHEGTLDVALMFVPSESVYYELLMLADSKGQQLDSYCRDRKVIAVSPNTLYAHLCVIHMGMRGMQIEENAKRLVESLSGMQKQMDTFTDVFEKLGTHLKNAQQSYNDADKRLEKTQSTLTGLLGATIPQPAVESGQAALPLPLDSTAKKTTA
jgi:DNA recombination protein RmuC